VQPFSKLVALPTEQIQLEEKVGNNPLFFYLQKGGIFFSLQILDFYLNKMTHLVHHVCIIQDNHAYFRCAKALQKTSAIIWCASPTCAFIASGLKIYAGFFF
jgi:hypothetical protein